MNNRIKELRKNDLKLTQAEFAKPLEITGSAVSYIESGKATPDGKTINLICSTYNVNREWLETGEGEKFKKADDSLITKFGSLMATGSENKKELVRMILDMPDELFDAFYEYMVNAHSK
jgi:DNA-binding XRE family transcriptional regulator